MLSQKSIIRISCFVYTFLLSIIIIIILILASKSHEYFRVGPSKSLYVISVNINTWSKYLMFLSMICFLEFINVMVDEFSMPILGFTIYNPDKKIITEFTESQLYFYANVMFFLSQLKYSLTIMLIISQIDISLFIVCVRSITTLITTKLLLRRKIFQNASDNEKELETLN